MENFVGSVGANFTINKATPIKDGILEQYQKVIIESVITSFGLDIFIQDQHGGDVDTIHNVRQIGSDDKMKYKNSQNEKDYNNKGDYNSDKYHSHKGYRDKNREIKNKKQRGELVDEYTGEKIPENGKVDLDHIQSAKEIDDDRGRVLAGLCGEDLANSEENLAATNPRTNRSKKADTMDEFLEKRGDEYTEEQKRQMRTKDKTARNAYEKKIAFSYYTSKKFAKDCSKAAAKSGVKMGVKQAVGLIFTEIWFSVQDEIEQYNNETFNFAELLRNIARGIKRGYESAKLKYKELFAKFIDGALAGALASITTTLCNIFFTTAKNVVKIIRQSFASLVEASKILFFNPDNYTLGERLKATAKIIATGASVVIGSVVSEAISKTPIGQFPYIGSIVENFCGVLATGLLSCSLLYSLDNNKIINTVLYQLDKLHLIENEINYFKEQAQYFEKYVAEISNINIELLRKETTMLNSIARTISDSTTEIELNVILKNALETLGIEVPWGTFDDFDTFMNDNDSILVFN